MARRLLDGGGDGRDHEGPRSNRSHISSSRRSRGVSLLCVAAVVGSVFFVVEYVVCVWLRDHLARKQGDGTALLRLGVPSAVTREGRVKAVARRGTHSSGDGPGETASTRHSEWNGAQNVKAVMAPASAKRAAAEAAAAAAGGGSVKTGRRSSKTLTRLRDGQCEVSDCRVLISGCGRSGTHFLAEQFASAGIPISHETIGKAGAISWVHAAPFREELRELEEWFSDVDSVQLRSSKDFQFFPLFHMVRHPLAALTSLTECFCGCGSMSCGAWADPPSWKWAGKFVEFSDRYCARTINDEVCAVHIHHHGRLIRSMEYWLQWNELTGSQAHFRLQLETVNLSEVVEVASKLGTHMVGNGGTVPKEIKQKPFTSTRKGKRTVQLVSWDAMRSADADLEEKVWKLAQSYGYTREPPS